MLYNLTDINKGLFETTEQQVKNIVRVATKATDKFKYEQPKANFDISLFEIDKEKGLINLTRIANHFGKRVAKWKELPSTNRFLQAFFEKNPESENWTVVNGGSQNGTWASKKIALKFCEWISVDFEIFANEVLDNYFSEKRPKQLTTLDVLELATNEIKKLKKQNNLLENNNVKLASRDLNVEKVKDFKTYQARLKKDRGYLINNYARQLFFDRTDKTKPKAVRYAQCQKLARNTYIKETGLDMPKAKNRTEKQYSLFLEFLSKKVAQVKNQKLLK